MKLDPHYTRLALIYRHRGSYQWSTFAHYPDDEAGALHAKRDLATELDRCGDVAIERHIVRVTATDDQSGWIVGASLETNPQSIVSCPPRTVGNPCEPPE